MEPNGGLRLVFFLFIYGASIVGFIIVMTRRYKNKSFKFTWQTGAIKLDLRILAGGIAIVSILIMKIVLLLLDSLV